MWTVFFWKIWWLKNHWNWWFESHSLPQQASPTDPTNIGGLTNHSMISMTRYDKIWPAHDLRITSSMMSNMNEGYLVGGFKHGFYFSIYWECHHPNWRTHVFHRGRSATNQLWSADHDTLYTYPHTPSYGWQIPDPFGISPHRNRPAQWMQMQGRCPGRREWSRFKDGMPIFQAETCVFLTSD